MMTLEAKLVGHFSISFPIYRIGTSALVSILYRIETNAEVPY